MGNKIASFGEVMMRLQVPGHELLSQASSLNYSFSGTGVNVAAALSHLGHDTYLVSTIPDNPVGDAAISSLHRLGIKSSFINRNGASIGMYFLENGFGARPSRVTYSNRLESSFNQAPAAIYDFEQISKYVDIVHFCGITLAMNDAIRSQIKSFAKTAKQNGCLVVFDCNYRPSLWGESGYEKARAHYEDMLHLADIVFMNEKDALFTLGMQTKEKEREKQLKELLPAIADQYKIPIIAGTHRTIHVNQIHSLRGFLYKNNSFTYSKEMSFSVLDRIGSGDAFASAIIHRELKGYSNQKMADFAVSAAVLAHTITGDSPLLSEKDIIQAMGKGIRDVER
ncbi:sugar kinase [Gracilibacillus oryzae]|uniref:Sugar kinase n=1 Tax=Gracilibacillus oryzae TaxID=1672701 RepID=A0A7C8GRN1_9BACI|nr:sugar kinase [Gracilibacillus oryzae]KAB8127098.1 sugar kinase [Gracilibacillus oryzae]